jgi:hypothetical protein
MHACISSSSSKRLTIAIAIVRSKLADDHICLGQRTVVVTGQALHVVDVVARVRALQCKVVIYVISWLIDGNKQESAKCGASVDDC